MVLRSGPAFAAASVVAASEALRSAVVSAGVRLVEAASVAWGSQAPDSAAQFAWPASVVVAFVGAGAVGLGSAARRSRVRLGLLRLLILLLRSVRRLGRLHLGRRLLLRWLAIDCY